MNTTNQDQAERELAYSIWNVVKKDSLASSKIGNHPAHYTVAAIMQLIAEHCCKGCRICQEHRATHAKEDVAEARGDSTDKAIGVLNKFAEGKAHKGYAPNHKVEGLLTDFAGEYAEPYAYMTNDKPPAVQAPMARRKVVEKYAPLLFTQADVDRAVEEALNLYERDMQGYDFTPQEEGENTNALVADALVNSKAYVKAQLPPHNPTQQNTNTSNNALGGLPPRDWRHKGTGGSAQSQEGE